MEECNKESDIQKHGERTVHLVDLCPLPIKMGTKLGITGARVLQNKKFDSYQSGVRRFEM